MSIYYPLIQQVLDTPIKCTSLSNEVKDMLESNGICNVLQLAEIDLTHFVIFGDMTERQAVEIEYWLRDNGLFMDTINNFFKIKEYDTQLV